MSQRDRTWLVQSVAFFRRLHFYHQFSHLSDDAIATELLRRWQEMVDKELDLSTRYVDFDLLMWDSNRVWWEDLEADVCDGNDIYVETLGQWGAISRGVFQPTNIIERWASETGPIRIDFDHQGQHFLFYPQYLDDYIDINLLVPINRMIGQTGIQFEVYEAFDQTAFVVALRSNEKEELQEQRGWKFAHLTDSA